MSGFPLPPTRSSALAQRRARSGFQIARPAKHFSHAICCRSVVARLRYDDEGACLERIAGTFDAGEGLVGAPRAVRRGELAVTASVGGRRYGLACTR